MNPFEGLANFLNSFQGSIQLLATAVALLAVMGTTVFAIKENMETGRVAVIPLVVRLVVIATLWVIAFNARNMLCWIVTGMGYDCPG